jgi:two-component system cell cycle sensor histidine kinase PleC
MESGLKDGADSEGLGRVQALELRDPDKLHLLLAGQSRIVEMIAEGVALQRVLEVLTRTVEQQVEHMRCSILLLSPDGAHLRHGAAPSLPEAYNRAVDGLRIGPSAGSCGTAAFTARPVIVTDIATDPLWADYRHIALSFGLRACWSTPILSKRGDVLGTFAMYYAEPTGPSPMHLDLIALATHLARVAIERDALIESLKEMIQQRDESISVLAIGSHELKSPLTVLHLEVEELLNIIHESTLPPYAEALVLKALKQMDRLGRLLADLLDVSRFTTGRPSLQFEDCDLAEIVRDTVARQRVEYDHRGCALAVDGVGPVVGRWDRMRIDQVLTNLLINALKYGRGRPVTVLVDADELHGRIQVQDLGMGIAIDQQESIFQRFGRAVAERNYEGVGLGLWITRQIIEALGGTIQVWSEPEKGSTFTVVLPRAGLRG